jgi:hypothetical protein
LTARKYEIALKKLKLPVDEIVGAVLEENFPQALKNYKTMRTLMVMSQLSVNLKSLQSDFSESQISVEKLEEWSNFIVSMSRLTFSTNLTM